MADDFEDLGTISTILDFRNTNWDTEPKHKRNIIFSSNIFPGTIHNNQTLRSPAKIFSYKITDTESQLYQLLLDFADCVGRFKSFWTPDLYHNFSPLEFAPTGEYLDIEKQPNLVTHGHERLFIRMSNGDRIARKIVSISQEDEATRLNLLTQIVGINVEDIAFCSLLYLARFDQDALEIEYRGQGVASTTITLAELLLEYDVWA